MNRQPLFRRSILVLLSTAFASHSLTAYAGNLDAEVNSMFNNLGAIGNYTAPGAFKGQAFNTFSGGSLYMRSPNRTYTFAQMEFPSSHGGCGGIDIHGGSFSFISGTEIRDAIKNITSALPGIAYQLAIESISPLLANVGKEFAAKMQAVNNYRKSSCELATALITPVVHATIGSSQRACAQIAQSLGRAADENSAMELCAQDTPSIIADAKASDNPAIKALPPFDGNFTWKALKKIDTIDDGTREIIMSMVGTVIYYPAGSNLQPQFIMPTINTVTQLMTGQSDAGGGKINVQLLKCNNYADCDVVTTSEFAHVSLVQKVETMMRTISNRIQTRTAITNDSAEIGFVNNTSIPIWKMLSIGNSIPESGLADVLISQNREVIASDYAFTFMRQFVRIALAAMRTKFTLDRGQLDHVRQIETSAQQFLVELQNEQSTMYVKMQAMSDFSEKMQQLERTLRSRMSSHVIQMLGQSALALK